MCCFLGAGPGGGGAFVVLDGALASAITVADSAFDTNAAVAYTGGAIVVSTSGTPSTVTVSNVSFVGNSAIASGGAVDAGVNPVPGGGSVAMGATMSFTDVLLDGNDVTAGPGGGLWLYVADNGMIAVNSTITVDGLTARGNSAAGVCGGGGGAGGIVSVCV